MSQWHYTLNGQQQPAAVTWEALQGIAANGTLRGEDLVWTEGMAQWSPASTVANLFAAAPAASTVTPPAGTMPYPATPGAPLNYGYLSYSQQAGYADFGTRFLAWLIDYVITLAIGFGVGAVIGFTLAAIGERGAIRGIAQLSGWVVTWLYYALQESSPAQATFGKRALGLRVTTMEGERISFGRATGRFFAKIISGLIIGIGYLMVIWTEKKQGLHDMMASTLVIKKA